ncbi:MAG: thioredoxin family protein [Candidatus Aenigmarchaeota archaeon]|nr:thioredoxin family protein [Candidatus Aenigmarchaeota archaeon]
MKIEILGSGCPKCKKLAEHAKKAAEELKIKAEIIKVTDIDKIIEYGVISTPALVIDGKIKSSGRIPEVKEIEKWLK